MSHCNEKEMDAWPVIFSVYAISASTFEGWFNCKMWKVRERGEVIAYYIQTLSLVYHCKCL